MSSFRDAFIPWDSAGVGAPRMRRASTADPDAYLAGEGVTGQAHAPKRAKTRRRRAPQ